MSRMDICDFVGPDIDPDYDHNCLGAWVDDDGTFYAVGADNVIRPYGDGENEARRLLADLADPGTPATTLDLGAFPRLTCEVGPKPAPPFGMPGRLAPLNSVEEDADAQLLDRISLAIVLLFLLYMALQFFRSWLAGHL